MNVAAALERMIASRIRQGDLRVRVGDGPERRFGDGSGAPIEVRLAPALIPRLLTRPSSLTVGEGYMDGAIEVDADRIVDLLGLILRDAPPRPISESRARRLLRDLRQANGARAARRHASHHYDHSVDFYRRFLDADLQYSCAYFANAETTLEAAQAAKKARIIAKLRLRPGDRVLDIGCGWGGLALEMAGEHGAEVVGITLATEQLAVARARAAAAGLADRARFEAADYRTVQGPFDRVVSVGMFEHVGRPNYDAYFRRIAEVMPSDGVALVHSIGRRREPGMTNPFMRKYIFPGYYVPVLSEVLPAVERAGLIVADAEILRLHYAETLCHWRARFAVAREEIAALYDERFCRMWEFYLAASEASFRWSGFSVFQLQLVKTVDAAPVTRAYLDGVGSAIG